MIAWVRYRRTLRRLEASKQHVAAGYAKDLETAKQEGASADAKYGILSSQQDELSWIDDEIAETISRRLIALADKLGVPIPWDGDKAAWETSPQTGLRHLSTRARAALQTAILKERRDRLQLWELRVKIFAPVLTAAVGVIGALIGLVAIFKK